MGRKIVITSNCQTAAITASLQTIFPFDTIVPRPLPWKPGDEAEAEILHDLSDADVWVFMPEFLSEFYQRHDLAKRFPSLRTINICSLLFSGFHPDLCYVKSKSTGAYISQPYNSAIGFWSYKHGLDIDDALKLFSSTTYQALGYFDVWDPSIEQMKTRFERSNSDVDFWSFFLAIKRRGNFMHTINHPKAETLVQFARHIAMKIGHGAADVEINITDGLNMYVWPLYPEIADRLSLPGGSHMWTIEGRHYGGISAFLNYSYERYGEAGFERHDLEIDGDERTLDRVLGPLSGIRP